MEFLPSLVVLIGIVEFASLVFFALASAETSAVYVNLYFCVPPFGPRNLRPRFCERRLLFLFCFLCPCLISSKAILLPSFSSALLGCTKFVKFSFLFSLLISCWVSFRLVTQLLPAPGLPPRTPGVTPRELMFRRRPCRVLFPGYGGRKTFQECRSLEFRCVSILLLSLMRYRACFHACLAGFPAVKE